MIRPLAVLCAAWLLAAAVSAQPSRNTVDLGIAAGYTGDATVKSFSGPGVPPGASLDTGNVTALMLSYEFLATPNVGVQLSAALGGSMSIDAGGTITAAGAIAKADVNAGTVFVNYHFFDASNALRPFLGIGINYTGYSGVTSYQSGPVSLGDAWGLAVQGGARYAFDEHWSLVGAIGLSRGKTDITIDSAAGPQQASLNLRPAVFSLGIGYSF